MKSLIYLFTFLFAFIACNPDQAKEVPFSIEEALIRLPFSNIPDIVSDLKKGNSSGIKVDTIISDSLFCYSKESKLRKHKLYVARHSIDSLRTEYLTVVDCTDVDSIFCNTRLKLYSYSIALFELKDSMIKDITGSGIKMVGLNENFNELNSKKHTQVYPTVSTNDFFLNYFDQRLTFTWQDSSYKITDNNKDLIKDIKNSKLKYIDSDFIKFYNKFATSVLNNDTLAISSKTYFPLREEKLAHDEYYGLKDTLHYFFKDDIGLILYYLRENMYPNIPKDSTLLLDPKYFDVYFANKIGRDSVICENSLAYASGYGQLGIEAMFKLIYIKLETGYKLAGISSYSLMHDGE